MVSPLRPVPPPRNKALIPCAVCGCLLLILLAMAFVGVSAFRKSAAGIKVAEAGAERFLAALEKPDNPAAFALFAAPARQGKTAKGLSDTMATIGKR